MPFLTHRNQHVLFIHIPKTGGTAVTEWMRSIGPIQLYSSGTPGAFRIRAQHLRNVDIAELFTVEFFAYRFAIVRNPYDRTASEYRFRVNVLLRSCNRFFKPQPQVALLNIRDLRQSGHKPTNFVIWSTPAKQAIPC